MPKAPTLSAHAARNPAKPVQQPRQRHESQATKASRALAVAQRMDNDLALTAKFNEIFRAARGRHQNAHEGVQQDRDLHSPSPREFLKNAITHRLSKEAKDNGEACNAHNEKINLSGKEYQAYKNSLTEEEKKDLLEDLAESKNLKEHGVHATNKAVALDAMQTSAQVGKVIIALHSRTAAHGFAMFTRGHPNDPATPSFVESDMASKFFKDTFDCSVWDVVRKFELWSCNRDKLTFNFTGKITGDKTVTMSWTNYKIDIVHTHGVEMAGWPSSVVMVAEEVEALRESGAVKQRKQRSDKNKPRGPRTEKSKATDRNTSEDDSEEEPMPVSAPRVPNVPTVRSPQRPTPQRSLPVHPTPLRPLLVRPTPPCPLPTRPTPPHPLPVRPTPPRPLPVHPTPQRPLPRPPLPLPARRSRKVSTAAGQPQTSQAVMSATLRSTSPATSLSNAATAFTGTLAASSATPAAFSPTSPAASLSSEAAAITSTSTASSATSAALSAGTMPFGSQLAGNNFNFDFVGMDFGPMPLFPSASATDELTNDGVPMRINTSNREDFAFDGGFNGGSGVAGDPSPSFVYNPTGSAPSAQVSGGTAGYMGATDNIFPGTFIPAVPRAAPTASGPGAFMSVFSVATNTVTQKRKRAEGDGVEKPVRKACARRG
ncbi:hypothetical protein B0H14DRAFT_3136743 [Mycena olivaceomarginata]|nr:hypothetical protein B0H14DRAFT_3136743 [Mycena olivaceomarginata]